MSQPKPIDSRVFSQQGNDIEGLLGLVTDLRCDRNVGFAAAAEHDAALNTKLDARVDALDARLGQILELLRDR